jgi:hypothetical protein
MDELFSTDTKVYIKEEIKDIRPLLYHIIDPTR